MNPDLIGNPPMFEPVMEIASWISGTQPDLGSVPDWLAGLGAIFALIFAGWAARSAHKTNHLQGIQLRKLEEREEERNRDERKGYAARVAAWIDTEFIDGQEHLQFFYSNSGPLPVYNVRVRVIFFEKIIKGRSYDLHLLPPTTGTDVNIKATGALRKDFDRWLQAEIPSARLENGGIHPESGNSTAEYSAWRMSRVHKARRLGVEIEFEDCEGRLWTRDHQGRLRERHE